MRLFKRILDLFVSFARVALMVLVGAIVLLMLNELFMRNILDKSFSGMTEMAGLFFIWMAFLGICVLYDRDAMIRLDIFVSAWTGKKSKVLKFIQKIVGACLGVAMMAGFTQLYPYVSTTYFSSMPFISELWKYLAIFVCGAFLTLRSIYDLLVPFALRSESTT